VVVIRVVQVNKRRQRERKHWHCTWTTLLLGEKGVGKDIKCKQAATPQEFDYCPLWGNADSSVR
jgi:hypothetical protein